MKKTMKRIITGILAVSTIASSAFLLTGCGEKSDKEKFMDALGKVANYAKNDFNDISSEEFEKETIELNLLDKIVSDKLYTLSFTDEYAGGFYIRLNDTIDIDGYTVELRDKTNEYDPGYYQDWDIKKDGEKLASFEMHRETYPETEINNNKITVSIDACYPTSEDYSEVDFEFTEESREFEIEVPAALTVAGCKEHMDELKAAAWDEFKDNLTGHDQDGVDHAHPTLDCIYFFHGDYDCLGDSDNADKTHVVFEYSVNMDEDVLYFGPNKVRGVIDRPFIFNGELKYCGIYTAPLGFDEEDLKQGTKIG